MTTTLGVDGWSGAWVAVRVARTRSGPVRILGWQSGRFADLLGDDDAVIGVDIPVGLAERGQRRCDLAARSALRPAGSRIFVTAARAAWACPDLGAANAWLRATGEPAMSAQTFALRSAIAEVAEHESDRRVVEVHPELAFVELAGAVPKRKKTAVGVAQRIAALAGWVDVVDALAAAPDRVPVDDALDALAAAWTAMRVADGSARMYPDDGGDLDRTGRPMRIYA